MFFRPWSDSEPTVQNDDIRQTPGPSSLRTPTKKKDVVIGRGAKLRKQTVQIVHNIKNYLRNVLSNGGVLGCKNLNQLTADATGVGITTVKKISSIDRQTYHTPTKKAINKTKLPFDKIDDFCRDLLRRTVYECFQNGVSPTPECLTAIMKRKTENTDYTFPYSSRTVGRLLVSMGFKYGRIISRCNRAETYEVITWRYRYLEEINLLRSRDYDVLYLDETWYDTNTCRMKNWSDDSDNCVITTPPSKGERIVILHCGGRSGFIDDALFVTHQKMIDAPADYHGTMTADIFEDWFENRLLRRLERPSAIVLDNASYHSRILNPKPTSSWKKGNILLYMQKHNISIPSPVPIIPVLLSIIADNLPLHERTKRFVIDEMAASYGHLVVRLPPYHCVFNPIEMVWSQIKRKVASQNLKKQGVSEVIHLLRGACDEVSPEQWNNYVDHVVSIEDGYRSVQPVFDCGNRICVNIRDTSSSSEHSDED